MFFNAHTYYSLNQSNHTDVLRILGTVLPDSAIAGVIGWTDLHDAAAIRAFSNTLDEKDRELGLGLLDHYELDHRSHDAYGGGRGYAFSHQTEKLRRLVAMACRLESPEKAEGLAHNFIEAGVDINLLSTDPTVQRKMREALKKAEITATATYLANFFRSEKTKTISNLEAYISLIFRYDLQNIDGWVALLSGVTSLLLGRQTDPQSTKEALVLATSLTSQDYKKVLARN